MAATKQRTGRRLIPTLVDELGEQTPGRIFASFATTPDFKHDIRDVSFLELARAVDRCAWWIQEHLGRSTNFETISYLGIVDLGLIILMLASIKTGHKESAPSDSVETHTILHKALDCRVLLTSVDVPVKAQELLAQMNMRRLIIPTLYDWLAEGDVDVYPYEKSFESAKQDPFVVLTTSGSTGIPKPVVMTHGTMAHHDLFLDPLSSGGARVTLSYFTGKRVFLGLAGFHSAAICFMVCAMYMNIQVLLAPPGQVTAEIANAAHVSGKIQASFLAPHVVTTLSKTEAYLENLRSLEYLTFGGAALPQEVGNRVMKFVHLFVSFGATETGFYALEMTDPEDWAYARPSPLIGAVFEETNLGLYELRFVRSMELEDRQGVFSTFPNLQEYFTKDVYSKHCTKENLWLYEGRSDDIIVMNQGLKVNPLAFESHINTHPLVSAVLMCGSGQARLALLVEPANMIFGEIDKDQFLAIIWPRIQEANLAVHDFAKVSKEMIFFTSPTKPMLRTGKGTVRRKVTLDLYTEEIDNIYNRTSSEKKKKWMVN